MKLLGVGESQFAGLALAIPVPQDVTMPLSPRRVVDFRDNRFDLPASPVKDVEEVERTHVVAELPQLREQANGSEAGATGLLSNDITYFIDQGPGRRK